jgi:TetR/AcrR family transcriptional regulator, cholesterol catabolism regulator
VARGRHPLTDKGVTRRREIAHAAARLFAKNGFSETGMDDIAAALKVSKPALYHYVRSKGELLFLIHDELIELLTQRLEDRLSAGLPPVLVLQAMIEDIVGAMKSHPGHLKVFFEHFREIPKPKWAVAKRKRDHYFGLVEELIETGAQRGEIVADNPRLTTLAIFGMVNWSYQWYRPKGEMTPAEVADYFWHLLFDGIGVGGPGGQAAPPADGTVPDEGRRRSAPVARSVAR